MPASRPSASSRGDRADLVSGLIFIGLGSWFLWQGSRFQFGTLSKMGPGFLPCVVAGALIALGLLITLRGAVSPRMEIGAFGWWPLGIVVASIVLFALLVERTGLLPASVLSILLVTYAGGPRPFWQRAAIAIGLGGSACALFIGMIGLAIPVAAWPW